MKKKLLSISLTILLVVLMLTSVVNASSFIPSLTASSTTVPESQELTVTIKVSNIDAGERGINSISGILSYDNSVFETLTTASIDSLNDWVATYTPDTGKLTLYKNTFVKTDEEVAQITLKTKTNTSGKTGEISITSIVASNSEGDISGSDISSLITVGTTSSSDATGNTSNTTNNTNSNATPITPINTNTSTNKNSNIVANNTSVNTNSNISAYVSSLNNSSTTESDIPYTGTSDNILRMIFIILVIAGISYFKYESIKEN